MLKKMTVSSVVFIAMGLLAVTGCSNGAPPKPVPSPTPSKSVAPTLDPKGSALKNLVVFQNALSEAGAGTPGHDISLSISSLLEAGFANESISHTTVTSKIGDPSDSVSLAVEFNGECLIGQFSNSWLTTAVVPITESGCLIGDVVKP